MRAARRSVNGPPVALRCTDRPRDRRPRARSCDVTLCHDLGVEQYTIPGGIELIGHLGGAGTYRSFVGRQRPQGVTIAFAMNFQDDPSPLIFPVVKTLAATHR